MKILSKLFNNKTNKFTSLIKFIGTGNAFYGKYNSSAYFIRNNNLFLIDCGEKNFEPTRKIIENKLNDIKNIYIFITHFHSDHIGSLPTLLFYLKYVNKTVPFQIICKQETYETLYNYLKISGIEESDLNEIIIQTERFNCNNISIDMINTQHSNLSVGLLININKTRIYYSGDSKTFPEIIKQKMTNNELDIVYQDISYKNNEIHMWINDLLQNNIAKKFVYKYKKKIFGYHNVELPLYEFKEMVDVYDIHK